MENNNKKIINIQQIVYLVVDREFYIYNYYISNNKFVI